MPKKKPAPDRPKAEKGPDPTLDPIFPLPFGSGIPPVKQGEGRALLEDTSVVLLELPYRAFVLLWEAAEGRGAMNYPKYKDGPLSLAADASLEAVYACRNAFHRKVTMSDDPLVILSEEEAQKIRVAEAKKQSRPQAVKKSSSSERHNLREGVSTCPKCSSDPSEWLRKKAKDGSKLWKCRSCGTKWSRSGSGEAPVGLSKGSERPGTARRSPKSAQGHTASGKKAKKKR